MEWSKESSPSSPGSKSYLVHDPLEQSFGPMD